MTMQLAATGPLPTGFLVWRSRTGTFAFTVVVKATFALQPGSSPLAAVQAPLRERDEYNGRDPARWLWAPADLVPYKMRGDVMLVGHAYAPSGAPVHRLRVRLAASGVDKTLEVHCERRRSLDGRTHQGAPFTRMGLGWDHASGAPQNPAGIPPGLAPDMYGMARIPNLQWPDVPPDRAVPAGFGPIAPWWAGRREKLGRHGAAALPATWHQATVPEDADDTLFQAAPPDQQPARIDVDGAIYLENMHSSYSILSTKLAAPSPRAVVERTGRPSARLALVADTLWLDTDQAICTVTWRGCIGLAHPDEAGVVRVWTAAAEVAALSPAAHGDDGDAGTATIGLATSAPTRSAPSVVGREGVPAGHERRREAHVPAGEDDDVGTATVGLPGGRPETRGAVLPFRENAAPGAFQAWVDTLERPRRGGEDAGTQTMAAPLAPRFGDEDAGAQTMAASLAPAPGALPFREGPPPEAFHARIAPPRTPRRSEDDDAGTVTLTAPLVAAPSAPFDLPPPAWVGPPPAQDAAPGVTMTPAEIAPPPFLGSPPAPAAEPAEPAASALAASTSPVVPALAASTSAAAPATTEPSPERRVELERRCRARESLDGLDLSGLSLAGIQLDGASLAGASFQEADLSGACLRSANLARARLSGANLSGADLSGSTLTRADLSGADLSGARLSRAKLQEAVLRDTDLTGADLTEARLDGAELDRSKLAGVKAAGSTWDRASLASCGLAGADLRGASFVETGCAGADFGKSQLAKATFRGARCDGASFDEADASGARLADVSAPRASFRKARLEGAQLRGAMLGDACFAQANLRRALADGADLSGADLARAELGRASLRDASLQGASLVDANLEAADLRGADLTRAGAARANLRMAKLDGIKKDGAEGL